MGLGTKYVGLKVEWGAMRYTRSEGSGEEVMGDSGRGPTRGARGWARRRYHCSNWHVKPILGFAMARAAFTRANVSSYEVFWCHMR